MINKMQPEMTATLKKKERKVKKKKSVFLHTKVWYDV